MPPCAEMGVGRLLRRLHPIFLRSFGCRCPVLQLSWRCHWSTSTVGLLNSPPRWTWGAQTGVEAAYLRQFVLREGDDEGLICIKKIDCSLASLLTRPGRADAGDDTLVVTTESRSLLIPLNLILYIPLASPVQDGSTHQLRFYFSPSSPLSPTPHSSERLSRSRTPVL